MGSVVVLSERDVQELLPIASCIEVMEGAFRDLAAGRVFQPLRSKVWAPDAPGLMGLMPAFRGGERPVYSLKEVCVFAGNPARGLDSHLGAVLLHDGETGELLAVINAAAVTATRTAAVSALATRLLARPDATVLAVIGAGVQARAHLEAIATVRELREIRVASRRFEKAEQLAAGWAGAVAVQSVAAAVEGADIVVTATSSKTPVLRRSWISGGSHINAVGSSMPSARELDADTVAVASLFVDLRESTVNESGDYLEAIREEKIAPGHIVADLGEVLVGAHPGRRDAGEITLFKSLGLAIEDLAAATAIYEKAVATGVGSQVPF